MTDNCAELQGVSKTYGEDGRSLTILDDCSFQFAGSKSSAILGPSGVGKTTLLHILGGLDRADTGSVRVLGKELDSFSEEELTLFRREYIGFVFQFHHLLPEFSALENVAMPLKVAGLSRRDSNERAKDLLGRLGLSSRLTHRPSQLSGGEQQRVAIARALIHQPGLVLADEPTGNLDKQNAEQSLELLLASCADIGASLVVVTHSEELASRLDEQYVMQAGGNLAELGL